MLGKNNPCHSGTSEVITHCGTQWWSDHRLLSAVTSCKEAGFAQSTPCHTTTVTRFSSKMSFNFPFAWRQQGGFCLASALSFIPQHARFQNSCRGVLSCICSTAVDPACGSTPCGSETPGLRNMSLFLPMMEVSLCLHFLPVSYTWWLRLKHESTLSSSL